MDLAVLPLTSAPEQQMSSWDSLIRHHQEEGGQGRVSPPHVVDGRFPNHPAPTGKGCMREHTKPPMSDAWGGGGESAMQLQVDR